MNEDIKNSVIAWANQLENACKESPLIQSYEIFMEVDKSNTYIGGLDKKNRWNSELHSDKNLNFQYQCRLFLHNNTQSFIQARKSADTYAKDVIARMLQPSNCIACTENEGVYNKQEKEFNHLETFDLRFGKVLPEQREEVMTDHINCIKSVQPQAKTTHISITEHEIYRYFRSSTDYGTLDTSTVYELHHTIQLHDREQKSSVHTHRFADICCRHIGWDLLTPPPIPSKTINNTDILPSWLFIFPANIVKEIVALLPPAFEIQRWEDNSSFLTKFIGQQIGSKKLHILDDATQPSGLNSRHFDVRGVPPKPLTLLKEGVVQDPYISLSYAQKHNRIPTGHYQLNGQLWTGNLLTYAGRRSQNMILADKSDALLMTHLIEPISLNIQTGIIQITGNIQLFSANGVEAQLGSRTIVCNIREIFELLMETANDQHRFDNVDTSSWILETCSILTKSL